MSRLVCTHCGAAIRGAHVSRWGLPFCWVECERAFAQSPELDRRKRDRSEARPLTINVGGFAPGNETPNNRQVTIGGDRRDPRETKMTTWDHEHADDWALDAKREANVVPADELTDAEREDKIVLRARQSVRRVDAVLALLRQSEAGLTATEVASVRDVLWRVGADLERILELCFEGTS